MQTHPPTSLAAFVVACSRQAPHCEAPLAPSDGELPTCATLRISFQRRTPTHGVSAQTVPLYPSWSASYASVAPSMKPSQCCPSGPNLTAVAGPNQNARINPAPLRLVRLIQPLAKVRCPPAKSGVDISPLLKRLEPAEEPSAALAGHECHIYLAGH